MVPTSCDSRFSGGRQAADLARMADGGLEEALDDARVETVDSAPSREDDAAEVGREGNLGNWSFKLSRKVATAAEETTFGSRALELFRMFATMKLSRCGTFRGCAESCVP